MPDKLLKGQVASKAKKYALYLLGAKDYSTHDLKKKLLKNYEEEICDEVIERIKEFGYLDDLKYAKKLCSHLIHSKQYGEKLVLFELKKHGISSGHSREALSQYDSGDYKRVIEKLINKKYPKAALDDKIYRRASCALVRRGHEYENIIEVIKLSAF